VVVSGCVFLSFFLSFFLVIEKKFDKRKQETRNPKNHRNVTSVRHNQENENEK